MKLAKYIVIFLVINFSVLAIGSWLMNNGPQSSWYLNLNKAPWTPPGWAFGVAWSFIMLCFSVYMAILYKTKPKFRVITLYVIQVVLNIIWNYVFFNKRFIGLGLTIIVLLTAIIATYLLLYKSEMKTKTILILPYFIWLCIATSLNGYIFFNN